MLQPPPSPPPSAVVFDLDGTLLDSDEALVRPYLALGVPPEQLTYGHVVAEECARLGVSLDAYLDGYDLSAAQPFPGVEELVARLPRWAVCSNKHPRVGRPELARLGWAPEVACFADAFEGAKHLGPVLDALGLTGPEVAFVGDTEHDRACAEAAGARFVWAGWNPRVGEPGDHPAPRSPLDLVGLLGLDLRR